MTAARAMADSSSGYSRKSTESTCVDRAGPHWIRHSPRCAAPAASQRSTQSTSRWKGWWSIPIVTRTNGLRARPPFAGSEESANDLALPVEALLALPLQQEQIAQRIAEPAGQRGGVDAIVDLDVDGPYTEELRDHEERERHAGAAGHEDVGPGSAQSPPRELQVPCRIGQIAGGRVEGP